MVDESLLDRLLPARAREAFGLSLVRFQIEELNGLGDRLRYLAARAAPAHELAEVRRRCETIVEALSWNRDEVIDAVWAWLEQPLAYPEDVFAPALLLRRLAPREPRTRRWFQSLSAEARALLQGVIDLEPDSI